MVTPACEIPATIPGADTHTMNRTTARAAFHQLTLTGRERTGTDGTTTVAS